MPTRHLHPPASKTATVGSLKRSGISSGYGQTSDTASALSSSSAKGHNDHSIVSNALSTFLTHGGSNNLLTTKELGRISITSKSILAASQHTFELLYHQAVQAGASPSGYSIESTSFVWREGSVIVTWGGERCLVSCFSNPSPAVVARCGYKRMAGCLRSKLCMECGCLAASANPLTFLRLCHECSEVDKEGYLILKSRAKSAFLLGEKDLRGIMSVTVPVCVGGRDCESTIYLLDDVRALAFKKWGGADGLGAKFDEKNGVVVSHVRFTRRSEEQRKRRKVEVEREVASPVDSDERRPFEDDKSLRSWIKHIPSEYLDIFRDCCRSLHAGWSSI